MPRTVIVQIGSKKNVARKFSTFVRHILHFLIKVCCLRRLNELVSPQKKIMYKFLVFCFLGFGLLMASPALAQYDVYKEVNGVEFSTRWVKEKWYKRKSDQVLSIQVINKNDYDVIYTMGIDFFQNTVMVESSPEKEYTLKAKKRVKGRLNGVMFKPEKLSQEDIVAKKYELELSGLEVKAAEEAK